MQVSNDTKSMMLGMLATYGARKLTDGIAWPIYKHFAPKGPHMSRKYCEVAADLVGDSAAAALVMGLAPSTSGWFKTGVVALNVFMSAKDSASSLNMVKEVVGTVLGTTIAYQVAQRIPNTVVGLVVACAIGRFLAVHVAQCGSAIMFKIRGSGE